MGSLLSFKLCAFVVSLNEFGSASGTVWSGFKLFAFTVSLHEFGCASGIVWSGFWCSAHSQMNERTGLARSTGAEAVGMQNGSPWSSATCIPTTHAASWMKPSTAPTTPCNLPSTELLQVGAKVVYKYIACHLFVSCTLHCPVEEHISCGEIQ